MDRTRAPRPLTHDERKAAEAAFHGHPCNPQWSESAKRVYDGLVRALLLSSILTDQNPQKGHTTQVAGPVTESSLPVPPVTDLLPEAKDESPEATREDEPLPTGSASEGISSRQEAVEQGWLIDVSETAQKLGVPFPVTVTRPLWERGIVPSEDLSEEEAAQRLRDVLLAFRLRLVGQPIVAPLVYFPAMLAFPPQEIPQPVLLSALIQADEQRRPVVTLLLPHEISMTLLSLN